jgi:hypothetical protein
MQDVCNIELRLDTAKALSRKGELLSIDVKLATGEVKPVYIRKQDLDAFRAIAVKDESDEPCKAMTEKERNSNWLAATQSYKEAMNELRKPSPPKVLKDISVGFAVNIKNLKK